MNWCDVIKYTVLTTARIPKGILDQATIAEFALVSPLPPNNVNTKWRIPLISIHLIHVDAIEAIEGITYKKTGPWRTC